MSDSKKPFSYLDKGYSALFKAQVAIAALQEDALVAEIAIRFGISVELVEQWKQEVSDNQTDKS